MSDLDTRAQRLLGLGLTVAEQLRESGPAAAHATLDGLDRTELIGVATLLAACVDINRTTADLVGWWSVRPLHADEYYEAPRPLMIERAAA